MSLSWLWAAIARVAAAVLDRWQSIQQARKRGAAEEQARALRDAERLEADGRASAEEARQKSPDEGDGWERLD